MFVGQIADSPGPDTGDWWVHKIIRQGGWGGTGCMVCSARCANGECARALCICQLVGSGQLQQRSTRHRGNRAKHAHASHGARTASRPHTCSAGSPTGAAQNNTGPLGHAAQIRKHGTPRATRGSIAGRRGARVARGVRHPSAPHRTAPHHAHCAARNHNALARAIALSASAYHDCIESNVWVQAA